MQFGICAYETKKFRKDSLFSLIKEVLIMALNNTFKILPKNKISLEANLSSFLPNKNYWDEDCKDHPSKKKNTYSIATKINFYT